MAPDRIAEPLDGDGQAAFRDQLGAFVSLYAFLSQIIPYGDNEYERLASFGHALLPSLRRDQGPAIRLGDDVDLEYYRLQRISSGVIDLDGAEETRVSSPTAVGTGDPAEKTAPLSEIIKQLNERFGTDFKAEDRLFFDQITERAAGNEEVRNLALANSREKFAIGIREKLDQLMIERMKENDVIVTRFLDDTEFREIASTVLAGEIFDAVWRNEDAEPI